MCGEAHCCEPQKKVNRGLSCGYLLMEEMMGVAVAKNGEAAEKSGEEGRD